MQELSWTKISGKKFQEQNQHVTSSKNKVIFTRSKINVQISRWKNQPLTCYTNKNQNLTGSTNKIPHAPSSLNKIIFKRKRSIYKFQEEKNKHATKTHEQKWACIKFHEQQLTRNKFHEKNQFHVEKIIFKFHGKKLTCIKFHEHHQFYEEKN